VLRLDAVAGKCYKKSLQFNYVALLVGIDRNGMWGRTCSVRLTCNCASMANEAKKARKLFTLHRGY
jgi:hypothetical protein